MKKLVVLFILSVFTMSTSFASGNPELFKEIKRKLRLDMSQVDLNDNKKDFVLVRFKIVDNEIKIKDIDGSNVELKEAMVQELYSIEIDSNYSEGKTYLYRFTFMKQ
jgi:hypothetical protein